MTIRIFQAPFLAPAIDSLANSNWYSEDGTGSMFGGRFIFSCERMDWLNADWLISGDTPHCCFYTNIPVQRRILFVDEPPEIREYRKYPYYIEQFGTIVSPYEIEGFRGRMIISNPHLGWFAGKSGELSSMNKALNYQRPAKTRTISMISSLKHKTEYHRKRSAFMNRAKSELGDVLDCFGREFNAIDDKLDAIAPYKYHIAIENSRHNYYWTEKLCDAWAGWALPIYCGDPAILQQIPDEDGIVIIDIDDKDGALRKIREVIEDDIYSSRIEAIAKCREWALHESNRYEMTCRIIEESDDDTPRLAEPELFKVLVSTRKNAVYELLRKVSGKFADRVFESYHRRKGKMWE